MERNFSKVNVSFLHLELEPVGNYSITVVEATHTTIFKPKLPLQW